MDFFDFIKDNKIIILIVSLILNLLLGITFGVLLYKYINYNCSNVCYESSNIEKGNIREINNITDNFYVEIKGAVKKPGVYLVNSSNIINDVISEAGGFSKNAYTNNINLSRKVSNELVVYVYTKDEYKKENEKVITKIIETPCECSTYDITNCTENKASEIIASTNDTTFKDNDVLDNSSLININTASKEELMKLSGIGESKALDIIAYRENNGNFKSIQEITNISGIGNSLYAKIKDNITV